MQRFHPVTPIVVLSMAVVLTALALRLLVLRHVPFGADFFTLWTAARAMVVEGTSPYSPEVTRRSQMGIYGRLATPGEDQVAFAYPPYALLPLIPTAYFSFDWAMALWFSLNLWLVLAVGLVVMRDPPIPVLLILPFLYPVARNLVMGQLSVPVVLALLLAWAGVRRRRPLTVFAGGVLLAWATAKPQLAWVLVGLVLGKAIRNGVGKWALFGFVGGLAFFWSLSWWRVPGWPVQWWHQVIAYAAYAPGRPSLAFVADLLPPPWGTGAVVLLVLGVLAAFLAVLVRWWRGRLLDATFLAWGGVITFLLHPKLAASDTVLVLGPLIVWWAEERARQPFLAVWGLFLLAPWGVFGYFFQGADPGVVTHLIVFLTAGLAFFLTFRPPPQSADDAHLANTLKAV